VLFAAFVIVIRALYPVKYSACVDASCAEFGLEPSLVYAVIRVESGFQPGARSPAGAVGLMQLMPSTGAWAASEMGIEYSDEVLLDPAANIRLGSFYLRHLLDQFRGDIVTALAAYNGGVRNVREWLQRNGKWPLDPADIRFDETRRFIQRVTFDRRVYEIVYPGYLGKPRG
jgi:soluble lytic murein transglycosylase